jgi:hypothetical protein
MVQSRCMSKRLWMPKGMASQPLGVDTQTDGGMGAPKMAPKVVEQWND